MKWSLKLGRFAGIDVYLHFTFLLLLGLLAIAHWREHGTIAAAFEGVGFFLALFACVLLHEYGHALTARRYGVRTRDITLLPIGGIARLERMPDKPMQEFWVAVAGPAVNVAIAAALFAWLALTNGFLPFDQLTLTSGRFAERLLAVNLFLVLFNLLPAFPMDGGRVLRSLLATRMDYARATQIAAGIGQFMAMIFVVAGFLLGHLMLMVIAFFVWIGASQEVSVAQMKSAIGGLPVARAMLTDFHTLAPGDTLARAMELILAGSQQDFPVVEAGRVVGVLTRADLLAGLHKLGAQGFVADAMQREFEVADANELLESAFARGQAGKAQVMPVLQRGELVGLLTAENVGEFVLIREALGAAGRAQARPPIIRAPAPSWPGVPPRIDPG
jgi:Zn-dependent protease